MLSYFKIVGTSFLLAGSAVAQNSFPTTGKVGIGTTDPQRQLVIVSPDANTTPWANTNNTLLLINPMADIFQHESEIIFNNGSSNFSGIAGNYDVYGNQAGGSLRFGTKSGNSSNGANILERMRITSEGKVGIGTTSPGYPLTVSGAAAIGDAVAGYSNPSNIPLINQYLGSTVDAAVNYILVSYANTNSGTFGASGFDGQIYLYRGSQGAYNSATEYDFATKNAYDGYFVARFNTYGPLNAAAAVTLTYGGTKYVAVQIPYAAAMDVYLTGRSWGFSPIIATATQVSSVALLSVPYLSTAPGGNIGIGAANPSYKLDVAGQIRSSSGGIVFPDGSAQATAFNPVGAGSGNTITQSNGNVGIGTTNPTVGLTVGSTTSTGAWYGNSGVLVQGANPGISFVNNASTPQGWAITNGVISPNDGFLTVFDINTRVHPLTIAPVTDNVGIGTMSPGSKLEVNGNVKLTSGSGASITFPDSTVQYTAWNGTTLGGDYAESVDVVGDRADYEPGDVLVIDPASEGKFIKSSTAYSTAVVGIYSTKPGLTGRRQTTDRSHMVDEVPMAMVGIVPTKVSAEGGAIRPGDLLVTANLPGHAMKGANRGQLAGAIVGKALGHLDTGTGVIEVAVSLQ